MINNMVFFKHPPIYQQLPQLSNNMLMFNCIKHFVFVIDIVLNYIHLFSYNRKRFQNFLYVSSLQNQ